MPIGREQSDGVDEFEKPTDQLDVRSDLNKRTKSKRRVFFRRTSQYFLESLFEEIVSELNDFAREILFENRRSTRIDRSDELRQDVKKKILLGVELKPLEIGIEQKGVEALTLNQSGDRFDHETTVELFQFAPERNETIDKTEIDVERRTRFSDEFFFDEKTKSLGESVVEEELS